MEKVTDFTPQCGIGDQVFSAEESMCNQVINANYIYACGLPAPEMEVLISSYLCEDKNATPVGKIRITEEGPNGKAYFTRWTPSPDSARFPFLKEVILATLDANTTRPAYVYYCCALGDFSFKELPRKLWFPSSQ